MPKISLLILTYNSSDYIERLFDSIFDKIGNKILRDDYEIVIVDNASTDDTPRKVYEYLAVHSYPFDEISEDTEFHKSIRVHVSGRNKGYAAGINLAAKFARGEVVVIINPDATLVSQDFEKVYEAFVHTKKMAVAGLKIVSYDDKPEGNAGSFFNPLTFLLYILGMDHLFSLRFSPRERQRVDYVSGGFIAFKKDYFELLNGYDEDYFMYVEDMDLCYRAKKEGLSVYFLPYATIQHKGQGSSSKEFAIVNIYKGLVIFSKKHYGPISIAYMKSLLSLKAALIIFLGSIFRKQGLVSTYKKALNSIS